MLTIENFVNDLRLNQRDQTIVDLLIRRLPLLSLSQIAAQFFANDRANAVRSLRRLIDRGLLHKQQLLARTPPAVSQPICCWQPGQDPTPPTRIAYRLTRRWLEQGTRTRVCYSAGPQVQALTGFALPKNSRRVIQASHELGLAQVYLHFLEIRKLDAAQWIGEQACAYSSSLDLQRLLPTGSQRPDAVLCDELGSVRKAIEYGGYYNSKRIDRFHRWCQQRRLSYELW